MKVRWIPTTEAVYHAIFNQHIDDFCVFSSFTSNGNGDPLSAIPDYMTEWGFKSADAPLIKYRRYGYKDDEKVEYWIACISEDDEERKK